MTLRRLEAARIWHYVGLVPWTLAKSWAMTLPEETIETYIKIHPNWRDNL